jgi:hypothetical protein
MATVAAWTPRHSTIDAPLTPCLLPFPAFFALSNSSNDLQLSCPAFMIFKMSQRGLGRLGLCSL